MTSWLAVALGGAIGAVGRYAVMRAATEWMGSGFPYATLMVNVLGSFILGAVVELFALKLAPSPEVRAFLVVGVLGAFTTFSTFSMDTITLVERGQLLLAGGYVLGSVALSIAGFWLGLRLVTLLPGA